MNNANLDSSLNFSSIGPAERVLLFKSLNEYLIKLTQANYAPCIAYNEEKPFDFFWQTSHQFDSYNIKAFQTISEACEKFYHEKDRQDRVRQKAGDLLKLLSNRIDRADRKITALNSDLEKAANCDKYRLYGDLITASLHDIKVFSDKIKLINCYDEDMSEIEIPMDKKFGAIQNAQRYYKLYNKLKKAQTTLSEQIIDAQEEIQYLESQIFNLENSTLEIEMNEIREELASLGLIKSNAKNSKKKIKPSAPHKFISSSGFEIFVGKNNLQNEILTMKSSFSSDIWLHVKDFAGSHVVIRCNGNVPDDATLYEAACLAAFYSKASSGSKIPVDYTQIKNVKKPKGSKPGMVTYDVYKTILAEPKNPVI